MRSTYSIIIVFIRNDIEMNESDLESKDHYICILLHCMSVYIIFSTFHECSRCVWFNTIDMIQCTTWPSQRTLMLFISNKIGRLSFNALTDTWHHTHIFWEILTNKANRLKPQQIIDKCGLNTSSIEIKSFHAKLKKWQEKNDSKRERKGNNKNFHK